MSNSLSSRIIAMESVFQFSNIYQPGDVDVEAGQVAIMCRTPKDSETLNEYSRDVLQPAVLGVAIRLCELGRPETRPVHVDSVDGARVAYNGANVTVLKDFSMSTMEEMVVILVGYGRTATKP